jgi:hypothetical protein
MDRGGIIAKAAALLVAPSIAACAPKVTWVPATSRVYPQTREPAQVEILDAEEKEELKKHKKIGVVFVRARGIRVDLCQREAAHHGGEMLALKPIDGTNFQCPVYVVKPKGKDGKDDGMAPSEPLPDASTPRRNAGLMIAGIVMASVGGAAFIPSSFVAVAAANSTRCTPTTYYPTYSPSFCTRGDRKAVGAAAGIMVAGNVLIAAGIPMAVLGALPPKTGASVEAYLGPLEAGLRGAF